jgi:hypothetical protein
MSRYKSYGALLYAPSGTDPLTQDWFLIVLRHLPKRLRCCQNRDATLREDVLSDLLMPTQEPFLSIAVSLALHQKLVTYQENHRLDSLSDAVSAILADYFKRETSSERYASLERVEDLENMVGSLREQIQGLRQQLHPYSSLASVTNPIAQPIDPLPDDEIEDEPDEILYDFLQPD